MTLFALGYGMAWPVLQALLTGYGKEEEAGRLLGWFQTVFSVALIVGPIWSGYVFAAAAPQTVFAISAGLMVLALMLSVGIQRLQLTALHHEQPCQEGPRSLLARLLPINDDPQALLHAGQMVIFRAFAQHQILPFDQA